MKVYTEIIYTWDDNKGKLVEESSKSFEYEGEVTLCDSKRYPHAHFGGTLGDILDPGGTTGDIIDDVGDVTEDITDIFGGSDDFSWDDFTDEGSDQMGGDWGMDETLGGFDFGADDFPTWDYQQDLDNLGDLGQGFNEDVTDLTGGFQDDAETWWDENTDTLNDMGDTFDYNVNELNTFVDNTVAVLGDTSSLINQGLGATIDINNPNALIVNPQGWYDDAFKPQGDAKIWYDWMMGNNDDLTEHGVENLGNLFNDYADTLGGVLGDMMDIWPSDGGASDNARNANRLISGDPFGNQGKTRRLIQSKKTFQSEAPSLINA